MGGGGQMLSEQNKNSLPYGVLILCESLYLDPRPGKVLVLSHGVENEYVWVGSKRLVCFLVT